MPKLPRSEYPGWHQSKSGTWYHEKSPTIGHELGECPECRQTFFRRKFTAKGEKGGKRHYCSKSCASKATGREQDVSHLRPYGFKKGQRPHNYKGVTKHSEGYLQEVVEGGRKLQHRCVMEEHLGRSLQSSELVHHRDGNKENNAVSNLEVMTQSEHTKVHKDALTQGRLRLYARRNKEVNHREREQ